jgi:steroid 5-alpha reductase family enzyme
VWYGISFIIPLAAVIISRLIRDPSLIPIRVYVVFAMICIWGFRLAIHIGVRHNGEDFRYKDMRTRWTEVGGNCGFVWRTILYVFLMQGLFALIANGAALYTVVFSAKDDTVVTAFDIAGIVVWLLGFLIEVISDEHLRQHIADKTPGKKKFV